MMFGLSTPNTCPHRHGIADILLKVALNTIATTLLCMFSVSNSNFT